MMVRRRRRCTVRYAALHASRRAEQLMSMPALHKHRWTIEELERLIDERPGRTPRYELVDGELIVTPAPANGHQRIVLNLLLRLHPYVVKHQLGEVLFSGAVRLTRESYFEPDVYVIPAVEGRRQRADVPVSRLLLASEVLSPSAVRHDRVTKRRFFQSQRVPEYWVVDGDGETFEVWRPDDERPAVLDERLEWHPAGANEPFVLSVREFFAEVSDEQPR